MLLIHGLGQTAWIWTPVARRLRGARRVVAMDLRGHGLSDAPTETGAYDLPVLAEDAIAAAEGSGLAAEPGDRVVLVGHGFGAMIAVEAARALGSRCAGVVLVDGGWEGLEASTGLDVDEFLRGLDEPPEVLRSMTAFLADREAFDPASWDADQEHAARATVVETHAGRVVPVTRPHVTTACVQSMFAYDPLEALAPWTRRSSRSSPPRRPTTSPVPGSGALAAVDAARAAAGRPPIRTLPFRHDGHNLMRYRPDAVSAAILSVASDTGDRGV